MASDSTAQSFERAISALRQTVSPADAAAFKSTKSEDVWKAAEEIQEVQRVRKSLRNMRRVEPFLKALEKYSRVIEVLCNGTPYLPWIWVSLFRDDPLECWLILSQGSHQVDASGKISHVTDTTRALPDTW
jgi:hypothetical protein